MMAVPRAMALWLGVSLTVMAHSRLRLGDPLPELREDHGEHDLAEPPRSAASPRRWDGPGERLDAAVDQDVHSQALAKQRGGGKPADPDPLEAREPARPAERSEEHDPRGVRGEGNDQGTNPENMTLWMHEEKTQDEREDMVENRNDQVTNPENTVPRMHTKKVQDWREAPENDRNHQVTDPENTLPRMREEKAGTGWRTRPRTRTTRRPPWRT